MGPFFSDRDMLTVILNYVGILVKVLLRLFWFSMVPGEHDVSARTCDRRITCGPSFDIWRFLGYYNKQPCDSNRARKAKSRLKMQALLHWLRYNWLYLGKPPWETGITPPELIEYLGQHPPGKAIDLGCGTGTNLLALARAGWQVTGVDFALHAVRTARKKLREAGLHGEVRQGDVSRLETVQPASGQPGYDLVLDIGCYHGLPEAARAAYRENLPRILAPGGHFLLYANWRKAAGAAWGVTDADQIALQERLLLENRADSQDRWERGASWMRFRAPG